MPHNAFFIMSISYYVTFNKWKASVWAWSSNCEGSDICVTTSACSRANFLYSNINQRYEFKPCVCLCVLMRAQKLITHPNERLQPNTGWEVEFESTHHLFQFTDPYLMWWKVDACCTVNPKVPRLKPRSVKGHFSKSINSQWLCYIKRTPQRQSFKCTVQWLQCLLTQIVKTFH